MSVAGTPSASACRPDAYRLTCPAWWLLPVATLLAQAALLTKASRLHRRRPNAGPPNPWLAVNLLPATQCYVVTGDTCNETTFSGPFPDKAETEGRNSFIKCYISLTVHLSIILVNNQLFSMYLFISLFHMFLAAQCSSSGESNCIITSSGIQGVTGGKDQTSGGCSLC